MTEPQGKAKPGADAGATAADNHPAAATGGATPPPVSPSGEPTPWQGDPGFPVAPGWMLVDPRWLRKGIPRWLHYALLAGWALFIAYIVFLFMFHTPGPEGFKKNPPAGLPGQPLPATAAPANNPPSAPQATP